MFLQCSYIQRAHEELKPEADEFLFVPITRFA